MTAIGMPSTSEPGFTSSTSFSPLSQSERMAQPFLPALITQLSARPTLSSADSGLRSRLGTVGEVNLFVLTAYPASG
jgi:hypothetical protein